MKQHGRSALGAVLCDSTFNYPKTKPDTRTHTQARTRHQNLQPQQVDRNTARTTQNGEMLSMCPKTASASLSTKCRHLYKFMLKRKAVRCRLLVSAPASATITSVRARGTWCGSAEKAGFLRSPAGAPCEPVAADGTSPTGSSSGLRVRHQKALSMPGASSCK